MQDRVLQLRNGSEPRQAKSVLGAPLEMGHGVIAEVIPVFEVDGFQQQAQFDALGLGVDVHFRYSQTRSSESNLSMSTGLAR